MDMKLFRKSLASKQNILSEAEVDGQTKTILTGIKKSLEQTEKDIQIAMEYVHDYAVGAATATTESEKAHARDIMSDLKDLLKQLKTIFNKVPKV